MSLPNSNNPAVLFMDDEAQPNVYITAEAWRKVHHIVATCDKEVAWMGFVDELETGDFLITEVFVPRQHVTGATVDIDAEDLGKKAFSLSKEGKDPSMIRYHGHSHVNMSVSPSGTDQKHIKEYLDDCDWYIRSIHNKKGEMKMDIFDRRPGKPPVTYQCVPLDIWETCQTDDWYNAVDSEVKENVLEKTYKAGARSFPPNFGQSYSTYGNYYGRGLGVNQAGASAVLQNMTTSEVSVDDIIDYLVTECSAEEREQELRMLSPQERAVVSDLLSKGGYA
jgi:hypothetical protein